MERKILTTLSAVLMLLAVGQPTVNAATVGYWRFEEGNFLGDSSGNGYTLTNGTMSASVTQTTPLPSAGNGSDFFNPVPQTGAVNNGLGSKGADAAFLRSGVFDLNAMSATETYSVEMLVNVSSVSGNAFIMSYYDTSETRSWIMQLTSARELNFQVSETGSGYTIADPGITLDLNTDYYLGVVVDLTSAVQAERSVTFYLQDLTNGGALTSTIVDNYAPETTFASNDTGIAIGGTYNISGLASRIGLSFDEVRYSNAALSQGELLVSIPEPSSLGMLAGLLGVGLVLRRRTAK